ncbi:MAG: hypothetical protein KC589_03850 [Nanoarchaeota archaeon]|nr:hypothetical protein [Nanoarchaeota archaeon]
MFESISNLFVKKIENKGLISSYSPLSFNDNISISKKYNFSKKDIKSECLDPSNSSVLIFNYYSNILKDTDKLMFEGMGISFDIFEILPGLIGREYNKTCSFYANSNSIDYLSLFEIVQGEGYFFLEKMDDNKIIKIIKFKKGEKILIPKNYAFTIINTSLAEALIIYNLHSNDLIYEIKKFEKFSGTILYFTNLSGFIRNQNVSSLYTLEEINSNNVEEYNFNTEFSIYEEFIKLPEKFIFLKD